MSVAEASTDRKSDLAGFLDSNVILYLLSDDAGKVARTEQLLRHKPVISVQVLNEVSHVGRRKFGLDWLEIEQFLTIVRALCKVVPLMEETHDTALSIARRYKYTIYDSCIIASASMAGCRTLFSEDMQNGQALEGLVIRNPYV